MPNGTAGEFGGSIGKLLASLGLDTREFMQGMAAAEGRMLQAQQRMTSSAERISKQMDKIGSRMQQVGKRATLFVTLPLIAAGGIAFKYASDIVESINKVDVSFKDNAETVKQWAKTTLRSYGMAEQSSLDMAAMFGDMSTSMGMTTKQAAKMSMNLVGLAGDLASFKNISIDVAQTALAAIFTGETESLKRLGIVMTQANLNNFALSRGINKTVQNMTQAEQVMLRYEYVMSMTRNAQGDFARTSESSANQMRIFTESLKETAAGFGRLLLPVITPMIKRMNEYLDRLSKLSDRQKKFILIIAGTAAALGPLVVVLGTIIRMGSVLLTTNPYVLLAAGIAAAVAAIATLTLRTKEMTIAKRALSEIAATAEKNITEERLAVEKLLKVAQDEAKAEEDRRKAVETLNRISPEYLGNLTLEKINTDEVTKSVEAYIEALRKKARQQAAEQRLVELEKKLIDVSSEMAKGPSLMDKILGAGSEKFTRYVFLNRIENARRGVEIEIDAIQKYIEEGTDSFIDLGESGGDALDDLGGDVVMVTGAMGDLQAQIDKAQKQLAKEWDEGEIARLNDVIRDLEAKLVRLQNLRVAVDVRLQTPGGELAELLEPKKKIEVEGDPFEQWMKRRAASVKASNEQITDSFYKSQEAAAQFANQLISIGAAAESLEDFARSAWNAAREYIATRLAMTVAEAVWKAMKEAGNPWLGIVLGGLAGGATAAMFNRVVPKLAKGAAEIPPGFPNDTYLARLSSGETVYPAPKPLGVQAVPGTLVVKFVHEGRHLVGVMEAEYAYRKMVGVSTPWPGE